VTLCIYIYIYIYIRIETSALALAHPLSSSMGTAVQGHFVGAKWPEHEIDLSFHLLPSLRISGAIPLFCLFAFIVKAGRTLPLS
jgi:hypothetical protein